MDNMLETLLSEIKKAAEVDQMFRTETDMFMLACASQNPQEMDDHRQKLHVILDYRLDIAATGAMLVMRIQNA